MRSRAGYKEGAAGMSDLTLCYLLDLRLGHQTVNQLCFAVPRPRIGRICADPRGKTMPNLNPDVINPVVALIAGILILIMPRLLNYVVAIYLIVIGLLGLSSHFH
jgi:hypothetical protein